MSMLCSCCLLLVTVTSPPPEPLVEVVWVEEVEVPTDMPGIAREAQDVFRRGVRLALAASPDYDAALTAFEEATRIDPEFTEAWLNVAAVHLRLRRPEAARGQAS